MLVFAAAFFSGCIDSFEEDATDISGTGTVTINISQKPQTRAVLSSSEDNMIDTLGVWLTDNSGTILQYKESRPSAVDATVVFDAVPRGEHRLYIVANYPDLTSLKTVYAVGKKISAIENVELPEITNATAPTFAAENGITSSLIKDIVVSPGNNLFEALLERTVGRFTVTFRNGTSDKSLFVGSIGLSKDNPSRGYLFGKVDHSDPAGTELLEFPNMTQIKRIGVGEEAVVYDTYLYESTPAISGAPFRLGFTSGLYAADKEFTSGMFVEGGTTTAYKPSNNEYEIENTSTWYMIRAGSSSTYYLYDNNGTLSLGQFTGDAEMPTDDEIKKYCWTFSAKSGGNVKITNVGTERQIIMTETSVTLGNSGTGLRLESDSGVLFYLRFGTRNNYTYSYLSNSSNNVNVSESKSSWVLRPITKKDVTIETHFVDPIAGTTNQELHELKYIDQYGVAQSLEHICRNEHINLTVNVYHHVAKDEFVFSVAGWNTISNETTFD